MQQKLLSSMSSQAPLIWFLLTDSATGEPYKGTTVSSVLRSSLVVPVVDQFRDAVKAKYSNKLSSVDAADLLVYKNKAAFDKRNLEEEKEEPLEEDSLLDGLGFTEEDGLIVVIPSPEGSLFRGDVEVGFSPSNTASNPFSLRVKSILTDPIDVNAVHLQRQDILAKLSDLVCSYKFVRMTSPAASGKSSLMKMYQHFINNAEVIWINCLSEKSIYQLLADKGIDLNDRKCRRDIAKRYTLIFFDDAQAKYDNINFWEQLIKGSPNWLPSNVKFVIASTHLLPGGIESPVEFSSFPSLGRDDFLLTAHESDDFLELPFIGLPLKMKIETFKKVLIHECGGLIGALRQSIDSLKERFSSDIQPSEAALLQYYLSDELLTGISRCFAGMDPAPIGKEFKNILRKIFRDEKLYQNCLTDPQDIASFKSLQNAGIFADVPWTIEFSSPLAKRYYFKWMYTERSGTLPSSLRDLIRNVVASMSSTVLKNSTLPGDFPKEAVFQNLFMEGLALYTPPSCSISPELSKIFPPGNNSNNQKAIPGEIDFYINGELRWGIELLVKGDGIGEHISRFSPPNGKYVSLAVNDYAVVDFRRNTTGRPTNMSKHPKRVSVFFRNDDYSVAHCLFGEDTDAVEITLAN